VVKDESSLVLEVVSAKTTVPSKLVVRRALAAIRIAVFLF
jgi:hypothetical protein